jgi:hypothetical protein
MPLSAAPASFTTCLTRSKHDSTINAGIDEDPEEIGRTAISFLVSQLNENRYGFPETQKEILVQGRWFDGSMLPAHT